MASHHPDGPKPARPVRTALIVAALAFLGGLVLMAWALTQWEPMKRFVAGNAPATVTVQPTANRPLVAASRSGTVAQALPPVAATIGQTSAVDTRIADLEGRMARIDLRAAAAAGNATRAEGLLIAFAARRALDRGVALGYIEGELRDRFGPTQPRAVAAIIAGAQQPVTVEVLHQELIVIAPDLIGGSVNEGWWEATQRMFSNLVIVRKQGTESPAPDNRVERAQLHLQSGQVENALAEIARLPARAKATDWMAKARRYIESHRALDIIEAAALTDTPNIDPAPEPAPAAPAAGPTL